jgi:hypothetical protein
MKFSPSFFLLVTLGVIAAGIVFFGLLHFFGARRALRRWADFNGFEILDFDLRLFSQGLVKWYVYFVRVRDKSGRERSGWVRCRSFLTARTFGDKSTVLWHEL